MRIPFRQSRVENVDGAPIEPLVIRKLADRSGGGDPPWPFIGLRFEGPPPIRTCVSTKKVKDGLVEGWLTAKGETVVHRPGGPPEEPWRLAHTFIHYTEISFHTVDGVFRYRVARNPDKWPEWKHEGTELGFGGEVLWTYELVWDH